MDRTGTPDRTRFEPKFSQAKKNLSYKPFSNFLSNFLAAFRLITRSNYDTSTHNKKNIEAIQRFGGGDPALNQNPEFFSKKSMKNRFPTNPLVSLQMKPIVSVKKFVFLGLFLTFR